MPNRVKERLRMVLSDRAWGVRAVYRNSRKLMLPHVFLLSLKVALTRKYIIAYWWDDEGIANFGDALSPILLEALSGREVVNSSRIVNFARKPVYHAIGSILSRVTSSKAVVWGSGFVDSRCVLEKRPWKVAAVRGPHSRRKLSELDVECPEVYGDPALLCPLIFKPGSTKLYPLGIVPHYVDQSSSLLMKLRTNPGVSIIDVTRAVEDVVQKIIECEVIASSSLHGLIVADAYGIPSIWIKMSNKVEGDDFKYHDYFLSVGRHNVTPLSVNESTTPEEILGHKEDYRICIDLGKLLESAPFLRRDGGLQVRR
jgi:pyruvyltransferase